MPEEEEYTMSDDNIQNTDPMPDLKETFDNPNPPPRKNILQRGEKLSPARQRDLIETGHTTIKRELKRSADLLKNMTVLLLANLFLCGGISFFIFASILNNPLEFRK